MPQNWSFFHKFPTGIFTLFLSSAALNVPFGCLLSSILYFSQINMYGPSFQLHCLTALNAPSLPVLFLQYWLADKMDAKLGAKKGYSIRFGASFFLLAVGLSLVAAFHRINSFVFLCIVALIGAANSVAFASVFQISTLISKHATPWVFLGLGVGNFAVLGLTFLFDISHAATFNTVRHYFGVCSGLTALGFTCLFALSGNKSESSNSYVDKSTPLLLGSQKQRREEEERDMDMVGVVATSTSAVSISIVTPRRGSTAVAASQSDHERGGGGGGCEMVPRGDGDGNCDSDNKQNLKRLFAGLAHELAATFSANFCYTLVTSFFIFVPTSTHSAILPLVLLYCNMFGDFVGKQLTMVPALACTVPKRAVTALSFVRPLYAIGFFVYVLGSTQHNDWLAYVSTALCGIIGGYCASAAYVWVPRSVGEKDAQKGSLLLTIAVYVAAYAALGLSFLLQSTVPFHAPSQSSSS